MRVTAFRAWFQNTVSQGVGAARRAGFAITRRLRAGGTKVEEGTAIGEDESHFGGRGSRAWFEFFGEIIRRGLLRLFDRSKYERRFARVEDFLRKLLGLPAKARAPLLSAAKPKVSQALKAPAVVDAEQAAKFKEQVRMGMIRAKTSEKADLHQLRRTKTARKDAFEAAPAGEASAKEESESVPEKNKKPGSRDAD